MGARIRRAGRRATVVLAVVVGLSIFSTGTAQAYTLSRAENDVGWMVNRWDRAPRGLPAYRLNASLSYLAHKHSAEMARKRSLYHTPNLGRLVTGWSRLGENVGVGPSLRAINDAFMRSSSHRANILCRCFRSMGVGVVRDSYGYYWVTQIFYA